MASRARKRSRKLKVDPVLKLAESILPAEQIRNQLYAICGVSNHSDADQRAMVRSGETKTLRRLTRIELMHKAGIINAEQAQACEFYAAAYQLGFQTIGCTANYGGAGGGGFGSTDLLARYKAQAEARENYHYARLAVPKHLLPSLDAVVLETGHPPHKMRKEEKLRFSLAAFLLHGQVAHLLSVAA
jgi:hypothetical protein